MTDGNAATTEPSTELETKVEGENETQAVDPAASEELDRGEVTDVPAAETEEAKADPENSDSVTVVEASADAPSMEGAESEGGSIPADGEEMSESEVPGSDAPDTATIEINVAASAEEAQQDVTPESAEEQPVLVGLLEALLLAHGDPVPVAKLQEVMKCAKTDVLRALEALKARCSSDECGVEVVVVAEKLQLRTKARHADQVRELMAVKPKKLSQAALETLAVIAYQQPVVKSEIDKIRGVDVSPTIKTLVERKLIKILGYQATVGQPALYGTTEEFLRIFGLKGLTDLPSLRDLKVIARDPGEAGNDDDESVEESEGETEGQEAPAPAEVVAQ